MLCIFLTVEFFICLAEAEIGNWDSKFVQGNPGRIVAYATKNAA